MECLLAKHLAVFVSAVSCNNIDKLTLMYFFTVTECEPLPVIANGDISYADDVTANYVLTTVATYTCNVGFFLDTSAAGASATRTCVDDNDNDAEGIFDRQAPRCVREWYINCYYSCMQVCLT